MSLATHKTLLSNPDAYGNGYTKNRHYANPSRIVISVYPSEDGKCMTWTLVMWCLVVWCKTLFQNPLDVYGIYCHTKSAIRFLFSTEKVQHYQIFGKVFSTQKNMTYMVVIVMPNTQKTYSINTVQFKIVLLVWCLMVWHKTLLQIP